MDSNCFRINRLLISYRRAEKKEKTFCIDTPKNGDRISELQSISGQGVPGGGVTVKIGCFPELTARVDGRGLWTAENPYHLQRGCHRVRATQRCGHYYRCDCVWVHVTNVKPLLAPEILTPIDGAVVGTRWLTVSGTAEPGNLVTVCLKECTSVDAAVSANGTYQIQLSEELPDGIYTVTVLQYDRHGNQSSEAQSVFTVRAGGRLEPLRCDCGPDFRTVEIQFAIDAAQGEAVVSYLLLPPGSPAPTPEEIVRGPDVAALWNGSAARGQFILTLTREKQIVTRRISGREVPQPLAGETGVVDGYLYDVYLYAVAPSLVSEVVSFGASAMAMPFAGGDGSETNPFEIRELTEAELASYPDLRAGHPLNSAGVNQTARMLDNIERMENIYDDSNRLYGIKDALALCYLLVTSFDLADYAVAYGGNGWRPIGNYDASHLGAGITGRHVFTGMLLGATEDIAIRNLPLTPRYCADFWVEHVGLIGKMADATVGRFRILTAAIAPQTSPESLSPRVAALAAYASNSVLRNIEIDAVTISLGGIGTIRSALCVGTLAGTFTGGRIEFVSVSRVLLLGARTNHAFCGGCVGYLHNEENAVLLRACTVTSFRTEDFSCGLEQCVGGIVGQLLADSACGMQNICVGPLDLRGEKLTGGGVIGHLRVSAEVTLWEIKIDDASIVAEFSACEVGGLIGRMSVRGDGICNIGEAHISIVDFFTGSLGKNA